MKTREQILKQAYLEGFEKGAQATGIDRDALIEHLWKAENANRTGYDPDTGKWTTYDDVGYPAVGPGIRVQGGIPEQDYYTQEDIDRFIQKSIDNHLERARRRYPSFDDLHPAAQKALFDMEYTGIHAPNMYAAITDGDIEEARKQNRTYVTVDEDSRRNTRRDNMRARFLDQWAKSHKGQTGRDSNAAAQQQQAEPEYDAIQARDNAPSAATNASSSAAQPDVPTHKVEPGNTFSGIARQQGVPVNYLRQYNPDIEDINHIQVGDKITLPHD